MANISLTPQEVDSIRTRLQQLEQQLNSSLESVKHGVNDIVSSYYHGQGSQAYYNTMSTWNHDAGKLFVDFANITRALGVATQAMVDVDLEAAKGFGY